jgi:single-strand DNA-binding protein
MYLNRVELIGFLGSEPEANFTPNGKAVTSLSLATKSSWMKGDERQERVEWHKIQVWGKLGEYAAAFKKGAHIRVEGELRSREYETAGGTKVRTYEIVASSIHNLRPASAITHRRTSPKRLPLLLMTTPHFKRQNRTQGGTCRPL